MRFKKSQGLNKSEQLLAKLCERSFLYLWTYPNLFKKPGKELIDLMIVFEGDIILFSDKSCEYPDTGDASTDWRRWSNRSITKSSHQIYMAERWLESHPDDVFLDAKCQERMPLILPKLSASDRTRVHRVCVVTGAMRRCTDVGRVGLELDLSVVDAARPLTIGKVSNMNGWLHVFDEFSLNIILSELTTIKDFIHYLNSKNALLNSGEFLGAPNEVELLSHYVWNARSFPKVNQKYYLDSGFWIRLESDAAFQAGRRENAVSFLWDALIEYITGHFINGTLEDGNQLDVHEYERMVRIMASETRFDRRILSKQILERLDKVDELKRLPKNRPQAYIASILESSQKKVVYVLLIVPQLDSQAEHRKLRKEILQLRCLAAKAVCPERQFILGIALDAPNPRGNSEDFSFMDTESWQDEQIQIAKRAQTELGFFLPDNVTRSCFSEDEYPGSKSG